MNFFPERNVIKEQITSSFSRCFSTYDANADLQFITAKRLLWYIDQKINTQTTEGSILEIGCGTGFISEGLLERYHEREIQFTDISPTMLEFCKTKLEKQREFDPNNHHFTLLDGEAVQETDCYSLIISNFAFQWFQSLEKTIHKLFDSLKPGGWLIFSIPLQGSFPQWKKACDRHQIPFRANTLPELNKIAEFLSPLSSKQDFWEETETLSYPSALGFFKQLKLIGAAKTTSGTPLPYSQMKILMKEIETQEEERVKISYEVGYFFFQKQQELH